MLPSSLPLPHLWSFLLPLPQKFNLFHRFRFQLLLLASASTSLLSMKQLIVFSAKKKKKRTSLLCKLFYLTCVVERAWYGMEWKKIFPYSILAIFFQFYFHSTLKIFHSKFYPILKFFFIFHSILSYQRNFRLEAMQHIFCCFASLQCCKQPLVKVRQQY